MKFRLSLPLAVWLWLWLGLGGWFALTGRAQTPDFSLVQERWFETRTAHFQVYSCGDSAAVFKLTARLEQFCEAYGALAGQQALASQPIAVVAFPSHEKMAPFLPLYQGQPANLAAFFKRTSDENLIVLALPSGEMDPNDMSVIYHEYTHLLFRHNDRFWPLWLKEGMAEVYSTFTVGRGEVAIASPIPGHLALLKQTPLLPLDELFAVTHDSPDYNESRRQGIFYAESWLLAQFLAAGDRPDLRARFGQYTALLRDGQNASEAFTNALGISLPGMTAQLQRYLTNGLYAPVTLKMTANLAVPIKVTTRFLTPVEIYFRLGDELLRINRLEAATAFFNAAQQIAPASPLPYEGLGWVASESDNPSETLRQLDQAFQLGANSFLTHYLYASQQYHLTAKAGDHYHRLQGETPAAIRAHLERCLELMPDYAPAHELLGFFGMVQGDAPAAIQAQLSWAIRLEPEMDSYLITLAQFQFRQGASAAARATLEPLLKANVDETVRHAAQVVIDENQP